MCTGVTRNIVDPQLSVISLWCLLVFWIPGVKSIKMDEDSFLVACCYLQPGRMLVQSLTSNDISKSFFFFNSSKRHCLHPRVLDAEWLISVSKKKKKWWISGVWNPCELKKLTLERCYPLFEYSMKLLKNDNKVPSIWERINPYLATNPEDRDSDFIFLLINVKMTQKNLLKWKSAKQRHFWGEHSPKSIASSSVVA